MMKQMLSVFLMLAVATAAYGQTNQFSNMMFQPATVMTASGQTSAPIVLGTPLGSVWVAGSWSAGSITVTGSGLTTATFGVMGSSDGGVTYAPILINAISTPTSLATTVTVASSGIYQVNLSGLTHLEFVTSGTFTATSLSLLLTATPNGRIDRAAAMSGGGVTSFNTRTGAVVSTTGDYSFSQISGTLLHSQLPTLLSSDIPNNAANTTGNAATASAFAATPTQASTGQYCTGITAAGNCNGAQVQFSQLGGIAAAGQIPVMGASGASHAAGAAPDPGATAGTTRYLREDATWVVPPGSTGSVSSFNGRTGAVVPASGDYTVGQVTGAAPLASPALTGTATLNGTAFGALATATQPLAGTGAAVPTGPSTTVSGDLVTYTGTAGQQADSGILSYQNTTYNNLGLGYGIGIPTTGTTTGGAQFGDRNTIVGVGAGTAITTARENVIIGAGALAAFTGRVNDNVNVDMIENGLNNAIGSYAFNALVWTPWTAPVGGGSYQSQDNSAYGQKAGPVLTGAESSDFFGNHNCTTCTQALNANSMGAHTLNDNTGTGTQYVSSVSNLGSGNWNGVGNKLFLTGVGNLIAPAATTPTYDDVQGNGSLTACLDCSYNVVNGSLSGNGIVHGTQNLIGGYNVAPLIDLSQTVIGGHQTCYSCTGISAQQVTLWGWKEFTSYPGTLSSVTAFGGNVATTATGTALQGDVFIGDNVALHIAGTGGNNGNYNTWTGSKVCQNCTTINSSTMYGQGILSSGATLTGSNLNCFGRASCGGLTGSESNDIAMGLNSQFAAGTSGAMQFGTGTNSVANSVQFNSWGSVTGLAGTGPLLQTGIANGTPTFTAGANITSVGCATGYTCTNDQGELTIVASSSASTGTIATLNFSTTLSTAPRLCTVIQNGGATVFSLGHGAISTTGFNFTADISVASSTVNVDYRCTP